MQPASLKKADRSFPAVFNNFFNPLHEWFDNRSFWGKVINVPAMNVTDNKDNYIVSLAVPGLKKEDFRIGVEGDLLIISSENEENKEEKEEKYSRMEYNYSSFSRSFTLPEEVNKEKIDAVYKDGVLVLTLPKNENAKKAIAAKQIIVK